MHDEDFWQTPDSFAHNGKQCKVCTEERNRIWIQEQTKEHEKFVEQLQKVSPEIEVIGRYRKSTESISLRCRQCNHEWSPTAGTVLSQRTKCPICTGSSLSAKKFREKVREMSPGLQVIGRYSRGQGHIIGLNYAFNAPTADLCYDFF